MRKIDSALGICLALAIFGCAYQKPVNLEEPGTPRVVIKKAPAGEESKENKEEFFESAYFPDLTRGCIENQSFPFTPKVWLLIERKKILLVGPEQGPPEFSLGGIREFNFPPGDNILHIERWQFLPYYGGWQKIRQVEVVKIPVAKFKPKRRSYWIDRHYGWQVIIYPEHSAVYAGYID
jgi:hypothetical protein